MDYIGYLELLSQQIDKVDFSSFDHGLFEFSTSKGESLNREMEQTDKRSNNNWDELPKKATLSGLKKMDAIEHPKFDLKKMIKDIQKSRVQIWNAEIKKTFDDVEKTFSIQNKRIIKLLRGHNWREQTQIPAQILALKNGQNVFVQPARKRRKLNTLFALSLNVNV